MSVAFVLLGCTLLVTTKCAVELSVCMGVLGCGWPIFTSVICCGTASRALMNIAPISASVADVITILIICAMFNTAPFFAGTVASFDKKNALPRGCRIPGHLGTKHRCGILVPCRLHGTSLPHPPVMLRNQGIELIFHGILCWDCLF